MNAIAILAERMNFESIQGDVLYQPCNAATQAMQNEAFLMAGQSNGSVLVTCDTGLICNDWCVCPAMSESL
jgi:hypothetical protein